MLAVPNYATFWERAAYVWAAKIARVTPLGVVSDSTATAMAYAYQRSKELKQVGSKQVCFVDMGHSYTSVTVVRFGAAHAQVLYEKSHRNLGARNIDLIVAEALSKEN